MNIALLRAFRGVGVWMMVQNKRRPLSVFIGSEVGEVLAIDQHFFTETDKLIRPWHETDADRFRDDVREACQSTD